MFNYLSLVDSQIVVEPTTILGGVAVKFRQPEHGTVVLALTLEQAYELLYRVESFVQVAEQQSDSEPTATPPAPGGHG
jgi:hypothetical protein